MTNSSLTPEQLAQKLNKQSRPPKRSIKGMLVGFRRGGQPEAPTAAPAALDETTALKSARQGTGTFQGSEVYEQNLGKMGTRQVLVQGKDAQGNILGWYLPDKQSAQLLGQRGGFLQPAKFNPSELKPSTTPTAQIKTAINFMFPEKRIAGQLTQASKGVK